MLKISVECCQRGYYGIVWQGEFFIFEILVYLTNIYVYFNMFNDEGLCELLICVMKIWYLILNGILRILSGDFELLHSLLIGSFELLQRVILLLNFELLERLLIGNFELIVLLELVCCLRTIIIGNNFVITKTRREKLQRSDVQLSERLASLGIMGIN